MAFTNIPEPILIELDQETREDQLDSAESWLNNVLLTQATFRQLAEDTLDKVHEPHVREYLTSILETAQEHEQKAKELYRVIGREPSTAREVGGTLVAKAREAMGDLMGIAGGAAGGWRDLHQLFLASLNAMSAFATAEQLGLALGIPEIVEITSSVTSEKFAHHRLLQEVILDMAPVAILYDMEI